MLYLCCSLDSPCSLAQAGLCVPGWGRCCRCPGSRQPPRLTELFRKPLPCPCVEVPGLAEAVRGVCLTGPFLSPRCSQLGPRLPRLSRARCCSGPGGTGQSWWVLRIITRWCTITPTAHATPMGVPLPRAGAVFTSAFREAPCTVQAGGMPRAGTFAAGAALLLLI